MLRRVLARAARVFDALTAPSPPPKNGLVENAIDCDYEGDQAADGDEDGDEADCEYVAAQTCSVVCFGMKD